MRSSFFRTATLTLLFFAAWVSLVHADGMADPCAGELSQICFPSDPVASVSLTAYPDSVPTASHSTDLSWAAENVDSCTSSGFSTGSAFYGSLSLVPGSTQTYTITCTSSLGTVSDSITVSVTPKPDFISGNVGSVSATVGNPVTLSAMIGNVGNADSVSPFYYAFTLNGPTPVYVAGYRDASLAAGANMIASEEVTFAIPGTYSAVVCADTTNAINETSETNNCSEPVQIIVSDAVECSDGIDNDGDGGVDVSGASGGTVTGPECGEGILILEGPYNYSGNSPSGGYFSWPSCEAAPLPPDADCSSGGDTNETHVPQCSDGIDNDGDGGVDFEGINDPGGTFCGNVTTQSGYDGEGHLDLFCVSEYEAGTIGIRWAYYGNNLQGGMCTSWGFDNGAYAPNGGGGESGGTSGEVLVTPTEDTDYGLSCSTDCNIYNGCIDLDGSTAEASGGFQVTVQAPVTVDADPGCESPEDETESPDPTLSCTVDSSSVSPGGSTTYRVTGGGTPYAWTASDGATGLGTGSTATRSFPSAGSYSMSVSSTGFTAGTCPAVIVSGSSCSNLSGSLSVSPNRITENTSTQVTFTYTATGVTNSCTIEGPGVNETLSISGCNATGSTLTQTLNIPNQGVYNLTCDGTRVGRAVVNTKVRFQEF